jgi:hypothetical protein
MLAKVLEKLEAAPQGRVLRKAGGWRGCEASAAVRLACSGWKCSHDALVMRVVVRKPATDEGLVMLVGRFPAVASLALKTCCLNELTDQGIRAVSCLPSITSLSLTNCRTVTREGLRAGGSITALDLSDCRHLTNEGLQAVSSLTLLTALNLSYCDLVTDCGMRAESNLPALTKLNISWTSVTD